MGLLDDIANKAAGDSANPLASHLMEMIHSQPGGLSGLLQNFHDKGLGELVTSWLGRDKTFPFRPTRLSMFWAANRCNNLQRSSGFGPEW
jgi:uncharacterized protein YidB (DUF937 family)